MKQKLFKENNFGITLIALVITIIILLILAGISISMIIGDNGILTQVETAKIKHLEAQDKEQLDLVVIGVQANNNGKRLFSEMYKAFEEDKYNNKTVKEIIFPKRDKDGKLSETTEIIGKTINGYAFKYTTEGGVNIIENFEDSIYVKGCTITYDANGGVYNGETQYKVSYGETHIIPGEEPTKIEDGKVYTFIGWKAENDNQIIYEIGEEITVTSNLKLYAQYALETYELTINYYIEKVGSTGYELVETKINQKNQKEQYNIIENTPDYTSDVGYKYEVDYVTSSSDRVINGIVSEGKENVTVDLYYKLKTYSLTLVAGDNIASVSGDGEYKPGQSIDISATVGATNGAIGTFEEWVSSDTNLINNISEQKTKIIMPNGDISLTAKASCIYGLVPTVLYGNYSNGVHNIKINDETYSVHVINYTSDVTYTTSTNLGNSSDINTNMVVAKYHGNLTINSGVTLSSVDATNGGPKGMFICVKGTLTNNGTISMTNRGANAVGQNVYLYSEDSNWTTVNKSGYTNYVPKKRRQRRSSLYSLFIYCWKIYNRTRRI